MAIQGESFHLHVLPINNTFADFIAQLDWNILSVLLFSQSERKIGQPRHSSTNPTSDPSPPSIHFLVQVINLIRRTLHCMGFENLRFIQIS